MPEFDSMANAMLKLLLTYYIISIRLAHNQEQNFITGPRSGISGAVSRFLPGNTLPLLPSSFQQRRHIFRQQEALLHELHGGSGEAAHVFIR
jgi:hypothetical protein